MIWALEFNWGGSFFFRGYDERGGGDFNFVQPTSTGSIAG
jgi:hypothetical protein